MMSAAHAQMLEVLRGSDLFAGMPDEVLEEAVRHARAVKFGVGQALVMQRALPEFVHVVVSGKVRLLGVAPGLLDEAASLALLEPGATVGWVGMVTGKPLETAIASTEAVTLTLTAGHFKDLREQYADFREAVDHRLSLSEAFHLAVRMSHDGADAAGLRESAARIQAAGKVFCLPADLEPFFAVEPGAAIFAGGAGFQEPGERLLREQLSALPPDAEYRVVVLPGGTVADHKAHGPAAERKPAADELDAMAQPSTEFPLVRAEGTVEEAAACIEMLSRRFGTAMHRHVVERVLRGRAGGTAGQAVSLTQIAAVAELAGLGTRLMQLPPGRLSEDEMPSVLHWNGRPAVAHEVRKDAIILASPSAGAVRVERAALAEDSDKPIEVLVVGAIRRTVNKRLDLSWFLPALRKHRRALIEVFIASFFVQLLNLGNPLIIQVIIDKVLVQNSLPTLNVLGVLLVVVAFGEAILGGLRTYLFVDTTNRIDVSLGARIIDHLYRLPLGYFQRRRVGEISSRIGELENIRQFLTGTALTVGLDAVFSVVYIGVMLLYSVPLTITALSTVPFLLIMTLVFSPWLQRLLRQRAERNAETQAHLVETLTGIQTIKAQSLEMRSRWEWYQRYTRFIREGFKTVLTATTFQQVSTLLQRISELAVLWVGAYLVLDHKLTLGQLIAFRIVAGYVTGPLLRLGSVWQDFQEVNLSMERLRDVMDAEPEQSAAEQRKIPMPEIEGRVRFDGITFSYTGSGRNLSNVSCEIERGSLVGVVGESGSGKSTLLKLVARLYLPDEGRILIDGYDVTKVELYSFRRQIGLVLQDNLLFDGTVQDNIALGNPDATPEEIIEAARTAEAHDFIMDLPEGYNTHIGEQGRGLSGGQRQRVAIARITLQNPKLLILDEATSALDYPMERQVCRNLGAHFKGRTVFLVTHRLRSIEHADRVLFLEGGRLVESGTHDELMAQRGRYYSLYQQQSDES